MRERIQGRVLVVEDSPARIEWFREHLPLAAIATSPREAVAALAESWDTVFLDFDLGEAANSLGAAQLLADAPPKLCVIHSANERGARELKKLLPASLVLPFRSFDIVAGSELTWRLA